MRDAAPGVPALTMPDLAGVRRTARHRVDSALLTLLRLGVDFGRVVLESAGPGESTGAVVSQDPPPGTPLTAISRIVLRVGGSGGLDLMPFPLRDESDTEFRADRLFAIFDNPALKLGFYLRQGGAYLALHADEPLTARRWLENLFEIDARPWPSGRWHSLARLVPRLHALGGTSAAVRVAMNAVFDLPVASVRVVRDVVPVPDSAVVRLGTANGRLGFDAVVGGGIVADARVEITYGPLTLEQWRQHVATDAAGQRHALLPFILPAHLAGRVTERWRVGDRALGSSLDSGSPPLLGVNAYLGASPVRRAA
ncbi:MAG: PASTA domain-containing protein [Gemmatimonadales bacterium]|nr:PASTA domain-containing protein [Gemmatimonadales bacterium]